MKPKRPEKEADELRTLLHAWDELPPPDAGLARSVQRAVAGLEADAATARAQCRSSPVWRRALAWLGLEVRWFRVAFACVAGGVLLGVVAAEWRRSRERGDMSARYLRWIDPEPQPIARSMRS